MVEKALDNISKTLSNSLNFLEIPTIRWLLIAALVLYSSAVVPNLSMEIARIFDHVLVKLLFVLLIVYVSCKDTTLAILLVLAYVLSIQMLSRGQLEGASNAVYPSPNQQMQQEYEQMVSQEIAEEAPTMEEHLAMNNDPTQMEEQTLESMQSGGEGPMGYNTDINCLASAGNGTNAGELSEPCTGVATWNPELNPQGMNQPMGFGGTTMGAQF
jgi:hypothetical protein